MGKTNNNLSYSKAMEKIESLLEKLENQNDNFDIDKLASNVEEAASLIDFCKKRLFNTEARIKTIIDNIEKDSEKID